MSDLISPKTSRGKNESGTPPVVIDVRSPEDFAAGHVPGVENIPRGRRWSATSPKFRKTNLWWCTGTCSIGALAERARGQPTPRTGVLGRGAGRWLSRLERRGLLGRNRHFILDVFDWIDRCSVWPRFS